MGTTCPGSASLILLDERLRMVVLYLSASVEGDSVQAWWTTLWSSVEEHGEMEQA